MVDRFLLLTVCYKISGGGLPEEEEMDVVEVNGDVIEVKHFLILVSWWLEWME